MTDMAEPWLNDPRLARALAHAQRTEVLQAESLFRAVLRDHPLCTVALRAVAAFAVARGDLDAAHGLLSTATAVAPNDVSLLFEHAQVSSQMGHIEVARDRFNALLALDPSHHLAWLCAGDLHQACGDNVAALRAWYQAITRAHKAGHWLGTETTDPSIRDAVLRNIERLRRGRRDHYFESFEVVRAACGSSAVARVERALTGYLGEWDATPPDPRQRPKFLYFPDLPCGPFHDPYLQPWAPRLREAWLDIRAEAAELLLADRDFESFLGLKPGQSAAGYVGGTNPKASWDAYFFYRHGVRLEPQHAQCPTTSAILESIDLCRVDNQAPEVCFSVIRPQSTIVAHHGVTNTRLVMHLPLIVPRDCALNIVNAGTHHWKEGELMMFDDTYQHEAWNNSDQPRLIVLMDCWNPHLTVPEQQAVKLLVEAIDSVEN